MEWGSRKQIIFYGMLSLTPEKNGVEEQITHNYYGMLSFTPE
jgi:hypothetical protein